MKNVTTFGKLIGLLVLFMYKNTTTSNELTRLGMRTIFLVYICVSVCLSCPNMRRRNYVAQTRACSKSVLGG